MSKRDIIVVGASAGGVAALVDFVKSLPSNLDASIFVVLHTAPYSPSQLPQVLSKAGELNATHAKDGEEIEKGQIYIAPPDHHLILEKGNRIAVRKGPKENRFRPSVDALFRSAAFVYGPRVVGIVFSGLLDDGTSGMWNIKRCGGVTIIQNPEDAQYPSMPKNVLQYVDVDHITTAAQAGAVVTELVGMKAPQRPNLSKEDLELLKMEVIIAMRDNAFEIGILDMGKLSTFTCPECHGALVSFEEGQMLRYRCHTGHAYTTNSLLASISIAAEEQLWKAMQNLEATTMLLNQIADHYHAAGKVKIAKQFKQKAEMIAKRARTVHDSIFTQELLSEDLRFENES
jgi:two-component system chemotaxis response regulator CheB